MVRAGLIAALLLGVLGMGQQGEKGGSVHHATGNFEVKTKPEAMSEVAADPKMGRMSLDKVFHGGIEGTSKGEMLYGGEVQGSAGYVAMEKVTGAVEGRKGSFMLQHFGTMDHGVPTLSVMVVPESGTEELAGLTGKMTIDIAGGKHAYAFDYAIAGK